MVAVLSSLETAQYSKAASPQYERRPRCVYSGGVVSEHTNTYIGVKHRASATCAGLSAFSRVLYHLLDTRLCLTTRLRKQEVIGAILYMCATRTLRPENVESLRTTHHEQSLRASGFRMKCCSDLDTLSHKVAPETTPTRAC